MVQLYTKKGLPEPKARLAAQPVDRPTDRQAGQAGRQGRHAGRQAGQAGQAGRAGRQEGQAGR